VHGRVVVVVRDGGVEVEMKFNYNIRYWGRYGKENN
jgi:hypothetical protein